MSVEEQDPKVWLRQLLSSAEDLDEAEIPHWNESTAHKIAAFFQANVHALQQLGNSETHRDFETAIETCVNGKKPFLPGITHEACEEDAELVMALVSQHVVSIWYKRIFPGV